MGKGKILFIITALIIAATSVFFVSAKIKESPKDRPATKPSRVGEKLIYVVRMGLIPLGKSTLQQKPDVIIDGKILNLIIFKTELAHFKDTEQIYFDPQTFLPIKIKRDVANWPTHENITEDYDQKNYTLKITKANKEDTNIQKAGPINNAILIAYKLRNQDKYVPGEAMPVILPNRNVDIIFNSVDTLNVPAGTFTTYHFQSSPKQIEIWLSTDNQRIPVKIQGLGKFGYSMVLKSMVFDKQPQRTEKKT